MDKLLPIPSWILLKSLQETDELVLCHEQVCSTQTSWEELPCGVWDQLQASYGYTDCSTSMMCSGLIFILLKCENFPHKTNPLHCINIVLACCGSAGWMKSLLTLRTWSRGLQLGVGQTTLAPA